MLRRHPFPARVIPGLWMGSAASASHAGRLVHNGIDCVVDLREEGADPDAWPNGISLRHVPMEDHGTPTVDTLRDVATTVATLVNEGHGVLVHCHAGVERAPMVVCAALVMMGWSLSDAYQRVMQTRPESAPTDGQLATLHALGVALSQRRDSASNAPS